MRGLDIRVSLAQARILSLLDGAAGAVQARAAGLAAQALGRMDAAAGIAAVPLLFADEAFLVEQWHHGHDRYLCLDTGAWRARCAASARDANTCCGLSYDLFMRRFSAAVDEALTGMSSALHAQAIDIAREYGYEPQSVREEARHWHEDSGYCAHGIELGYCPAGCGSGPDD